MLCGSLFSVLPLGSVFFATRGRMSAIFTVLGNQQTLPVGVVRSLLCLKGEKDNGRGCVCTGFYAHMQRCGLKQ